MKTILLTGGSGFLGKNIQESFLADKYQIVAPSSKELELGNTELTDAYFKQYQFDVIIHSAVKPSHRNAKDLSNTFFTNTRMFFNLERHRHEYEKLLVLGSGAIYDNRNYKPKMKEDEWTVFIPADDHGYCKYVCAKQIENSSNMYDLRIFGIFGKYEDYAIRFISNAICKTLFDLPITIKQNRCFDYLYVNDLMPVLEWFIDNNPKYHSYNITPEASISLLELAEKVKLISGKNLPIILKESGMGLEYSGNNQRLMFEHKFEFTDIDQAIKQLYEWYATQKESINGEILLFDK